MNAPRGSTLQSRSAFTLAELLVVIAIVGALMSVALPALSTARDAAQQAVCASNIRQLQFANSLYADDYGERFAPGAAGIEQENLHRWHGVREQVGEPFQPRGAPLTPYLQSDSISQAVRACPTFAPTLELLREQGAGFENSAGGYGYNNAFVGVVREHVSENVSVVRTTELGALRTRFAQPTSTIAFTDAALASGAGVDGLIEYSFAEPRFWPASPGARPNPSIHFRHAGAANVAWLDGHVSAHKRTFSWEGFGYGVDSVEVGLGWFGEHDDNRLFDYD